MAVTLDSTLLFKTASSDTSSGKGKAAENPIKGIVIKDTRDLIEFGLPNTRVVRINANHWKNSRDYDVLTYVDNDEGRINENSFPVYCHRGRWHSLGHSNAKNLPTIGKELAFIHKFDTGAPARRPFKETGILEEVDQSEEPDEIEEIITKTRSIRIQSISQPTMSSTTTTQTETGTITMTSGNTGTTDTSGGNTGMTAAGNSLSTPETIKHTLRSAMRRHTNTGPPPGGSGGGGGGFPGGGAPGGGGQPPAQPQQAQNPVPNNPDVKIMGSLPNEFLGDRALAEDFIEEVKRYLRLNRDVAGYDSPIKKAAFTLTLIKGKETAGWVQAMGNFLDTLDPVAQNITAVWDAFLAEFRD